MPGTRNILIVNFIGLSVLMLLTLYGLIDLLTSDINPVTIVGSIICGCLLIYFFSMLIWNTTIYRFGVQQGNYTPGHFRNAVIILVVGVVIPGLLILGDLFLVARYS